MPPGIGYSFQPGGGGDTPLDRNQQGAQTTVPQQAIRTLSLRVPQTQNPRAVAPLPLLNATGGGGTDLDMLLNALLRAFGPQMAGGFSGGPQGGGHPPAPRIRPIDDVSGNGGWPTPDTPPPDPAPPIGIPQDYPPMGPYDSTPDVMAGLSKSLRPLF